MNAPIQTPRPGPKPPPLFFAISIVSTLCLAAGIIGLFVPDLAPPLADRTVAFAFIGVGAALEAWAVSLIIGAAKRQKTQR